MKHVHIFGYVNNFFRLKQINETYKLFAPFTETQNIFSTSNNAYN